MNPSEFVAAIKTEVCDAASADTMTQVRTPSGRKPPENLRRLSAWFNQLTQTDQQVVAEVAAMAAHQAVFGFLCVLDGIRPIQEHGQSGELELSFVEDGSPVVRLNPPTGDMLHELFNAQNG